MRRVVSRPERTAIAIALAAAGMLPRPAAAQSNWTDVITVQPFPSPFIADWQRNPMTALLNVVYSGTAAQEVRIEGYVRNADRGELARVSSRQLSFGFGPVSQIYNAADILDWTTVSKNQQYTDIVLRTGMIPEGRYDMCADVLNNQNAVLAHACASFTIVLPDPPQLIFPTRGGTIAGAQPVFQWTPVRVPVDIGVSYRVRVVEILDGQTPEDALGANPSWYEGDVTSGAPMLVYPIDALPLEEKKQYAWRVEARDADGNPLTRGGQSSEIWPFSLSAVGNAGVIASDALPDSIDVVPGVARIKGLRSATVNDGVAAYTVNGTVQLELLAPVPFTANVSAQDLAIDKITLSTAPRITGGTVNGALDATAASALGGGLARFAQIAYSPTGGVTLTADALLPGADPVPLTGTITVTAVGLYGRLTAQAAAGKSLGSFGADPARLLVQRVSADFPSGAVEVQGNVELFGKDVGCGGVTASLDAQGVLGAQVSCTPKAPVSLVAAGDRTQFDLLTLGGTLALDTKGGTFTYDLRSDAQLKLDARPGGANCGASLSIEVQNSGVSSSNFTPRCDPSEGESSLGWLSTKLSSLALKKLAYTAGKGFDFELQVDLAPWIPDIPGFKLPAVVAVSITPSGLSLPALDVAMTNPPFILAGFGVQVKRVRLPAVTLSWDDWQAQSAANLSFSFDAELTLPKLTGEAACLTAQPITITNATLAKGRFQMHVDDRTFTPACGITLKTDASANLDDIALTEGDSTTAGGVQQAGSAAGSTPGCGGGTMASTICKTLNQMGLGGIDPCGNAVPDEWLQQDSTAPGSTTWRKCGGGPWKKVEQTPAPNLPDSTRVATLTQAQLDQRATETELRARATLDSIDRALDDPKCNQVLPDAKIAQLCDSTLKQVRLRADSALGVYEAALRDKYIGKVELRVEACIKRTAADTAATIATCTDSIKPDSIRTVLEGLITPPPGQTAPERRRWCQTAGQAGMVVLAGFDRSMELSGYSDSSSLAAFAVPLTACGTQASSDFQGYCSDTTTTLARIRSAAEAEIGYTRQEELMGAGSGAGILGTLASCKTLSKYQTALDSALAARARTNTTSMLAPPGAQPVGAGERGYVLDTRLGGGPNAEGLAARDAAAATSSDSAARGVASPSGSVAARPAPTPTDAGFEVRMQLDKFGGDLDVGFYPFFVVNKIPEVEGSIVLPSLFQCTDASGQSPPVTGKLRLGPRGEVNASVEGFVPSCPIDLAAVQVTVSKSVLTFSTYAGQQSLTLEGGVTAQFTAGASTAKGVGELGIDLLRGKLIGGSVTFAGPFDLALPREKPLVTFSVQSATLDTTGIHVDGRANLVLGQGQTIGTTFDKVTINPLVPAITDGQILFDASFGLDVGVNASGDLAWGATPAGAPLAVQSGVHIDLPSQIVLNKTGFSIAGDGGARLLYEGRDVANLTTKFSNGFALGVSPVGVANGMVDFQLNGVSMAYIDHTGFHPNLAYFASAILPARLPLPSEQVAYLELRDANNNLRVQTENTGQGIRLYTAPGTTVPLVLPALAAGRPTPPRIDVSFDLTLDPLGKNVSLGKITANIPAGDLSTFDLSAYGLPFAVQTLAYDKGASGSYQWTLAGALMLFDKPAGTTTDRIALTLTDAGRLQGAIDISPNQAIPLVDGSQNVTLTLQHVTGSFDADMPAKQFTFALSATSAIDVVLSGTDKYSAGATVDVDNNGVSVQNVTYANAGGGDPYRYLDLGAVQMGLANLRIPALSYTPASGFSFRMLFDAALRFPALQNLTLPPIKDIELTNTGFTLPAYEAPELNLGTAATFGDNATMTSDGPLNLGGFALGVKAFRMSKVSFNWFTGQTPSNWGFGFDLELGLGNLVADAPQGLKDMRVQILNAGFTNGRFTGTVEPITFPTPIDIGGIGKLYAIGGSLPAAGDASTPFSLTAQLGLDIAAALPVCDGATKITSPNATLQIFGDGWFNGTLTDVIPQCSVSPSANAPFTFKFGSSQIVFGYGNTTAANGQRARTLEMSVAAEADFPGVADGTTVSANGSVKFDLLQQKWIDGAIDVNAEFKYQPGDGNPYFAFNVKQARLDPAGLHFNGDANLRTADHATIGITFADFTFAFPDFKPTSGSVTFNSSFAVGVGIANGGLQWGVYSPTAPRPQGSSFRFVAPQSVKIDPSGVTIDGTATAELQFGDTTFASLQVNFINGFKVGFTPLGVAQGRANFILNGTDEVAHVDNTGFWPGNVFGVLPIPAKLGLPTQDVAYIELRDAQNNLLIETQTSATGLELRTKANAPVRLVVPGLAGQGGGGPPSVNVSFDVVVNPSTWTFVSGFVRAEAVQGAQPLMSLESLGIPLTLRKIAFEPAGNGQYALSAAGRFTLPASLNGLAVDVPNLVISAQGLTGDVQMGAYLPEYNGPNAQTPPVIVGTSFMGDTIAIGVTGAKLHFGAGASFALKGQITSALFAQQGQSPAVIKWSAAVTTATSGGGAGFTLQLDDVQNGFKLPIAVAEYEPTAVGNEPALVVTADDQEFKLRTSGVLTIPSVSQNFALTIAGLQVGTRGVVFPTVSISGLDQSQELDLFGAKFRLQDSTVAGSVVYPALKVGADQGVLSVTLSGAVDFMDNTSRFWGFKVATNGQFALAGASLIDRPIQVVDNYLAVDAVTIANNALRVDVSVTLPSPFDGPGAQKAYFTVNTDGQVGGGATIALIDQAPSLTASGSGPDTHFDFGVATVHLRYLALQLDFANLKSNSSIQLVSDFYLQSKADNRIKLGDTNGNTVQPGLTIGFDGNVSWGTVALAGQFDFDFDAVKLTITQVALPPVTGGNFAISIGGTLSLNVSAVSGSLDFQDFTIGSKGVTFSPSGLKGGELTIADVVHLQLSDIGYSGTPTTITITGGALPSVPQPGAQVGSTADADTVSKQVQVASYISFGGRVSVLDVFDGGVDRFLFYKGMDGTTHLMIQKATVKVMDIVDFEADFQYDETADGFSMFMGAKGHIFQTINIAVVGAFSKEATLTRAGMFVLVRGVNIQIGPYVTIKGFGGGFFLNPKPEWLEYVRTAANVSQTAGAYIAAPPSKFTVLFFGEAGIIRPELIDGRILITIADTYFRMDGAVVILSQDGHFNGDFHVQIGFTDTKVQGNIGFTLKYDGIVDGKGTLDVYVQSESLWGVFGTSTAKVVAMLDGGATIMIGPAGFYFDATISMGYDVSIIKLTGTMESKIWFISASKNWGAFVSVGVEASVLGGLAYAKGTLYGIILFESSPSLFAAAELSVGCPVGKWEGWVWVKFQNGASSAGLGKDDALEAAIEKAQNVASDMQAAKDQTQTAINAAKAVAPAAIALTNAELIAAYKKIAAWDTTTFFWMTTLLEAAEVTAEARLTTAQKQTEESYRAWYYGVLRRDGLPGDTDKVVQYSQTVSNLMAALDASRPQVESRIASLGMSIQQLNPLSGGAVAFSDPVRGVSPPTIETQTDTSGKVTHVLTSAPTLDVDEASASAQVTTAKNAQQSITAMDLQVRQQIAALERGLLTLRAVTTTNDAASLPSLVGQYASVASTAEQQFALQADVILTRQDWMRARLADLAAKSAIVTQWVNAKTASLAASQSPTDYSSLTALARTRLQLLAAFSGNQQDVNTFDATVPTLTAANRWTYMTNQANTSGRQLFYEIANAGMTDANTKADSGFTQLTADANTRLGTIRQAHAALSTALGNLYRVQADATGALYDLYDRYLFLRSTQPASTTTATTTSSGTAVSLAGGLTLGGALTTTKTVSSGAITADAIADTSVARQRFAQLSQDLTVPKLNAVSVVATGLSRYTAQLRFAWSAWHPSGTYEFTFRDWDPSTGGSTPFYSNGTTGSLASYRFTPDRTVASTSTRTFDVGVRGGAGFTATGRSNYTLSFLQGPGTLASVSGGSLVTDATPPSIPVVTFPNLRTKLNAAGEVESWTNDPNAANVTWSATDDESGVSEYQYALWSTPTGTASTTKTLSGATISTAPTTTTVTGTTTSVSGVIRPFASAGGREEANLDRLNLASGTPVYVAVKATNGTALTSGIGISTVLRYDATPPVWSAGAITASPTAIASAGADRVNAACAVQQPPYPGAPLVAYPVVTTMTWNGTLATAPTIAPPSITFNVPGATDAESGLDAYMYLITTTPESTYTGSGWVPAGARSPYIVASSNALDYKGQFYISIAPRNLAGGVGTPLVYGPFRPQDPTPPTQFDHCAGVAGPGVFAVQFTTDSKDDETGVVGYQYRVRDASTKPTSTLTKIGPRAYPTQLSSIDWTTGGSMVRNTAPLTLIDGAQYYVDVRAINGQGMVSAQTTSGPILYDVSPPPQPSASLSWGQSLSSGAQQLIVTLNAPDDPHSGLTTLQYAVGTTSTTSDVIAWTSQPVAAGASQLTLVIPFVRLNETRYVQLRTVNGTGLPSVVVTSSISNPQVKTIVLSPKLP